MSMKFDLKKLSKNQIQHIQNTLIFQPIANIKNPFKG